MKKFAIPLVIVLTFLCAVGGYAQTKVGGKVVDDTEKTGLQNATVMLLQAKDSILVDFTRVDEAVWVSG